MPVRGLTERTSSVLNSVRRGFSSRSINVCDNVLSKRMAAAAYAGGSMALKSTKSVKLVHVTVKEPRRGMRKREPEFRALPGVLVFPGIFFLAINFFLTGVA